MALVTVYDQEGNPVTVDDQTWQPVSYSGGESNYTPPPAPSAGQRPPSTDPVTGDITFYNNDGTVRGTSPGTKQQPGINIAPNTPEQDLGMLKWMATMNNVDVNDPAALSAFAAQMQRDAAEDPTGHLTEERQNIYENPTDLAGIRARQGVLTRKTTAENQAEIDRLTKLGETTNQQNADLLTQMQQRIDGQSMADAAYINESRGLVNELGGYTDTANGFDWANLASYQQGIGGINSANDALMGNYGQAYQQMSPQLQSTLQAQMLQSQAAQAYADPGDVAAQRRSAARLEGIAGGANDVNFYSLPGMSDLQGAYQGENDVNFSSIDGTRDLQNMARGSGDIQQWDVAGLNSLIDMGNGGSDLSVWGIDGYGSLVAASNGANNINFAGLDGVSDLKRAYQGSQDVNFAGLKGASDLEAAYRGAQDVHVGQEDPEAYAAMQDALGQYKSLTDPRVTDAERFLYEQARQNQERDERANRSAVLTSQRMRGLGGGASELADAAIGGAQVSRNRLLSDLGANAQAINRAQESLQGYAGLSSTMSAQANDVAQQNANNRLGALGQYMGLSTNVAQSNAENRLNALGQYTNLSTDVAKNNVNNQLEALYNRTGLSSDTNQFNVNTRRGALTSAAGIGSDIARANQSTRAGATGQYANLSTNVALNNADNRLQALSDYTGYGVNVNNNNMDRRSRGAADASAATAELRRQGFDETYKRGTAADQTAQFNETNRVDVQKYNQDYTQKERDAAWGRTTDYALTGLSANRDKATNLGSINTAQREANKSTFERNAGLVTAKDTVNTRGNTLQNKTTDRSLDLDGTKIGNNNTAFGRNATLTSLGIGTNNAALNGELGILDARGGDIAGETARQEAVAAEKRAQKRKEDAENKDALMDYVVPLHILG